jgi:hypothetical protein
MRRSAMDRLAARVLVGFPAAVPSTLRAGRGPSQEAPMRPPFDIVVQSRVTSDALDTAAVSQPTAATCVGGGGGGGVGSRRHRSRPATREAAVPVSVWRTTASGAHVAPQSRLRRRRAGTNSRPLHDNRTAETSATAATNVAAVAVARRFREASHTTDAHGARSVTKTSSHCSFEPRVAPSVPQRRRFRDAWASHRQVNGEQGAQRTSCMRCRVSCAALTVSCGTFPPPARCRNFSRVSCASFFWRSSA